MTSNSLPSTSPTLDGERHPSPPHDTLPLTNHTKAKNSDITVSLEKPLRSDDKQTLAEASPSMETSSESRTNSVCSADDSNLKTSGSENESSSSGGLTDAPTSEKTEKVKGVNTADCEAADTPPPTVSRTKTTGGLMDLLTTAVVDKDSTLLMDSSEDEWMSPQPLKEVSACTSNWTMLIAHVVW